MPDHVLFYVDLNQPFLLNDIPPKEHYGYVAKALAGARDIGLETMKDLVNYVCVSLIYGARLREDKDLVALLARVKRGEMRFSAAMDLMP